MGDFASKASFNATGMKIRLRLTGTRNTKPPIDRLLGINAAKIADRKATFFPQRLVKVKTLKTEKIAKMGGRKIDILIPKLVRDCMPAKSI